MPVTRPPAVTVAVPVLLLLHAPPAGLVANVVLAPTQMTVVPVIAAGLIFTVSVTVLVHPLLPKHVIVAVPADTPVTTPVDNATVATATLELVHVEPTIDEPNVRFAPTQTVAGPGTEIAGAGNTVATLVVTQPEDGGA